LTVIANVVTILMCMLKQSVDIKKDERLELAALASKLNILMLTMHVYMWSEISRFY
jgi:hypothetical protein